ncbi:MAG: hypothetical protein JO257_14500 [Deltaproteobacteria bacterium]|nr:hypothetical protein [Deltaproteobacteria bacterium]
MSSTRSKPTPHRPKPVSKVGLLAFALLLVLLAIKLWPRSSAATESAPAAKQRTQEAYAPAPAMPLDQAHIEPPSVTALEKSLAEYKAVSVYPPWSRPLGEETADKLRWNATVVSDLPMDDREGANLIYHFGADRWTVPFDEPFVSWIEVLDHGKRIPVRVVEANLISAEGGRAGTVAFHDDGVDGDAAAGDLRYSASFVPAKNPQLAKKGQQVRIVALIDAGGIKRQISRDFAYAPRKVADIVAAHEALRDGNLVVTLDVDVTEKGLYTFAANVMTSGGAPIVFGEKSATLDTGKQSVEVVMFGRAFVEKGEDGPYVVQDIRGMRRFIDTDEQNFYFTYPQRLQTQAYKHTQFSNAEWDAQEKRDTIANFERTIDETRAALANGETQPHPAPTVDPTQDLPTQVTPPTKSRP